MKEFEKNGREIASHWDDILRVFPNGHPAFVEPMEVWAAFVETQGRHDEAVKFLEKIIEIEERFLGPSPIRRAHRKLEIGGRRLDEGRLCDAERLLEEASRISTRSTIRWLLTLAL